MTDYNNGHECGFNDEGNGLVDCATFEGCSREFVRGYFDGANERRAVEESYAMERLDELNNGSEERGEVMAA